MNRQDAALDPELTANGIEGIIEVWQATTPLGSLRDLAVDLAHHFINTHEAATEDEVLRLRAALRQTVDLCNAMRDHAPTLSLNAERQLRESLALVGAAPALVDANTSPFRVPAGGGRCTCHGSSGSFGCEVHGDA